MEKTLEIVLPSPRVDGKNISIVFKELLQPSYLNTDSISTYSYPVDEKGLSNFDDNVTTLWRISFGGLGTNETEYKVAEVMWQVCPVILFIFGTTGNILILLMLRSLRLGRTSMHMYLIALAVSDMCVLYTGLLRWWIISSFGVDLRDQHVLLCKIHIWLVYVSLYISAWLLVFMTLERTCSTCMPHRVNTFCTKRRACYLIIFIVLFQTLMQSHFLFGMTLLQTGAAQEETCQPVSTEYNFFIHDVYPFVDLVLLSLIPFMCVILGNAVIIWKTFLSIKTAAELNLTSGKGAILRRRRASSMTVILICLSSLFLLTTSPTCVYNMWERGESAKAAMKTPEGVARIELVWASVNIVMYCNNTFNFYLYCLSGRKFRNEIRCQFSRHRADSHSAVFSAPSLQLHRCTQNELKYSRNKDDDDGTSKEKENDNRDENRKDLSNGTENVQTFSKVRENSIAFSACREDVGKFYKERENMKYFHLYETPYCVRKTNAYL